MQLDDLNCRAPSSDDQSFIGLLNAVLETLYISVKLLFRFYKFFHLLNHFSTALVHFLKLLGDATCHLGLAVAVASLRANTSCWWGQNSCAKKEKGTVFKFSLLGW